MKAMKKHRISALLLMFCLLTSIVFAPIIQAATDNKNTSYVIDDANLLSAGEQKDLNDLASKYSNKHNTSIVVISTDDTNQLSTTDYASMYYDTYIHDKDGYNDNCVLFLIDMDNRSTNIFAYEDAAIRINTERSDKILDVVTPKLSDGEYNDAIVTFIENTNTYLGVEPAKDTVKDPNNNHVSIPNNNSTNNYSNNSTGTQDNIFFQTWFQLVLAMVIGALSVGVMVHNSGGKVTTNSATYLDHGNSKLTGCYDHYIRTTTTRQKKPDNNNNSGGGGGSTGGTTGGGSSFSSGHERSF